MKGKATYTGIKEKLLTEYDPHRVFFDLAKVKENESLAIETSGVPPTFIDLFCGCGGITQGLSTAGFKPIASCELSDIASETHMLNFPECEHYSGDISSFNPGEIIGGQRVHVVSGGPPCQGFSVAGRRDPNDPRNLLFRQFVRIVEETQPYYFVMENVPGILTIKNGEVRKAIIECFHEIGYDNVSVCVLESADYGVPQYRSRAIFVGNRHGLPNPFPAPTHSPVEHVPIEAAICDLENQPRDSDWNHEWTKHKPEFEQRISRVPPGGSLYETYRDAYKRQRLGCPSMTIKENHGGTHIHPTLNRCISAREMARLQTFPDDFIFAGSMKKAMWQLGNAVPPRLAEAIGLTLVPMIQCLREGGDISTIVRRYEVSLGLPGEGQGCLFA